MSAQREKSSVENHEKALTSASSQLETKEATRASSYLLPLLAFFLLAIMIIANTQC